MLSVLETAEKAISHGDYGQGLALLEPLAKLHKVTSKEGSRIRMLMVTAWMGQGQEEKAISTCRLLSKCKDNELRQVAKQLLDVLEAPSLERPSNWSISIPNLGVSPLFGKRQKPTVGSKNLTPAEEIHPPTGPTKSFQIGFSTLVIAILIGLTILLSGCVKITTEINFLGPDRVGLDWKISSYSLQKLPWQKEFEDSLRHSKVKLQFQNTPNGSQSITAPSLTSEQANSLLQSTFSSAAEVSGIKLEQPNLKLSESNWIIGIQQVFQLDIDLEALPEIPRLNLSVVINPTSINQKVQTSPIIYDSSQGEIYWPLQPGKLNQLKIYRWQWNWLALGTLGAIMLMAISLILQSIRHKLGFGFTELPP